MAEHTITRQDRAEALEQRFEGPYDRANPMGFRALPAAEERDELCGAAEEMVTEEGFGAELVPVALGGRLERAGNLAHMLRPVFRRDLALGFGFGLTPCSPPHRCGPPGPRSNGAPPPNCCAAAAGWASSITSWPTEARCCAVR
ncbi:hypothetical protein [Streptomyces sp. NPDC093261]|uniref:hypothetical protein n=1 Tax=Streptomyces sp. NPDC093261 TaxID=3366037 RepID=UPI003827137E